MKYRRTPRFKEDFEKLPATIQELTKEKFALFKDDPQHPSLRIRKMQGREEIWEGHINMQYVFTFMWDSDPETNEQIVVFRRIGTHKIYEKP